MDCALCKVVATEPHRVVAQNDFAVVITNNVQIKSGHVMVMPVRHAENLTDLTPEEAAAFLQMADACMNVVTRHYDQTPLFVVNGWQFRTQPHLHAHILPSKESLRGLFVASEGTPRREPVSDEILTEIADTLRPLFQ